MGLNQLGEEKSQMTAQIKVGIETGRDQTNNRYREFMQGDILHLTHTIGAQRNIFM